jgi:hypothetical protein
MFWASLQKLFQIIYRFLKFVAMIITQSNVVVDFFKGMVCVYDRVVYF